MKKYILLWACLCYIWVASLFSYDSLWELDNDLDMFVIEIEEIIDKKWEEYRNRFLWIIEEYQESYRNDERKIYILDYVYRSLSEKNVVLSKSVQHPNILLIIADDLWKDAMPGFSEWSEKPYMPNIESMMEKWVRFDNLWVAPTCTPTRATILTGKYGFRTDVLEVDDPLSTSEQSLQSYLDVQTNNAYAHGVIGKWHLSKDATHPTEMWVWYYAGMLTGWAKSYTDWRLTENGQTSRNTEYITTKFTDLAINWIEQQDTPWFLWLAYTAPHTPFHLPPSDLHHQWNIPSDETSVSSNPEPYYMAAIEALDTEVGRLLAQIPEGELQNTTIIFIGDNGTPGQVAQSPYSRTKAKWSLYQWGINTPMLISGYGVSRQWEQEDILVNSTDIFSTIADIAWTSTSTIHDSTSFAESLLKRNTQGRKYVYGEVWSGRTAWHTIRNDMYKLIVLDAGGEEFYDLVADPYESQKIWDGELTDDQSFAKQELKNQIIQIQK